MGLNQGDDTRHLRQALIELGVSWEEAADGSWQVVGSDGLREPAPSDLEVGEGGSTLRFLLPLLAMRGGEHRLQLAPGLARRPHDGLFQALQAAGVDLELRGTELQLRADGVAFAQPNPVDVRTSSQFLSGFLLAGGLQAQTWQPQGAATSRGYLQMTVDMLRSWRGAEHLTETADGWAQQAGFGHGRDALIPGDASAAVFFAVAEQLLGEELRIANRPDPQHPDFAALELIAAIAVSGDSPSEPPRFDLRIAPDSGPALAVLAAHLPNGMRFEHIQILRGKESDRVAGMLALAAACGAESRVQAEDLLIEPTRRTPGSLDFDPQSDHRLAMAAAIASLRHPGIRVTDPDCVAKSFPGFWPILESLRS